jgi:hypothetical protein
MIEITAPDGTIVRFPEGTPDETIISVMSREYGQAAGADRSMMQRAGDWLTGARREENIGGPTSTGLPMTKTQAAKMTALMATTMSPDRLRAGIEAIEPDVQFREDSFGNSVAMWPRKDAEGRVTGYMQFYPNPAGLDVTDLGRAAGAVSLVTPVTKMVQMVGGPTRGLLGGAAIGGTEAALVEGASSYLSGAPYQVEDIPFGMAGGAAGEALARAVQGLTGLARSVGPEAVIDQSGNLLPRYAMIVREAGLDPDQVSAAVAADIASMLRGGATAETAAATAMSRNLPVPVPMTRGAATGDVRQQLFEDMASKGVYGDTAQNFMRGQRGATQEALGENLNSLLEKLRPEGAPIQRGAGGAAAQESLLAQRTAERARANELFSQARATPAVIAPDAALDVADAMRGAFRERFSPRTAPTVAALLGDFDRVASSGDIRAMMEWRAQTSGLRTGAPTVDSTAAGAVIERFDEKMAEAIDRALLSGDPEAVANWGQAIANYADFASTWKSKGGILNMLTEEVTRDGGRVLRIAPEQAADVVFGATASGLAAKTGLPRDLITLQRKLDPDQWNQLRQEAFIRLMETATGGFRGGSSEISGVGFKKAWDGLRGRNMGVVNGLFSKEEQKLIQQFADVAAKATNTAANTSNSAAAAGGIIQLLASSLGGTGIAQFLVRVPVARGLREAYGGARAAASTQRGMPTISTPVTRGGAGLGGAAGTSEDVQNEAQQRFDRFMANTPR